MLKRNSFLAAALLLTWTVTPTFAKDIPSADTVVASVNGTEITLGHMIVVRAGLPERLNSLPDDVLFRGILDQLIQQTALSQKVATPAPRRLQLALDNERRSLMASEEMDRVLSILVNERAIKEAYAEQFAETAPEQEYDASHILVETEQTAQQIIVELEGGADFAEMAKARSTGPSGPGGGGLGWFGTGRMVPDFEQAVVALEVGEISAPVQTQFGWHVIKLNDKRAKDAPALDDVRAQLKEELSRKAVETYLADITSDANIERITDSEIDPSVLNNLSLVEE